MASHPDATLRPATTTSPPRLIVRDAHGHHITLTASGTPDQVTAVVDALVRTVRAWAHASACHAWGDSPLEDSAPDAPDGVQLSLPDGVQPGLFAGEAS